MILKSTKLDFYLVSFTLLTFQFRIGISISGVVDFGMNSVCVFSSGEFRVLVFISSVANFVSPVKFEFRN